MLQLGPSTNVPQTLAIARVAKQRASDAT